MIVEQSVRTVGLKGYKMDINSDLGESFGAWRMGDDAAMLDIVTSANVACGFHAGDPAGILQTLRQAAARGVAVGQLAHELGYASPSAFIAMFRKKLGVSPQRYIQSALEA